MDVVGHCSKDGCESDLDCIDGCPIKVDCEYWSASSSTPVVSTPAEPSSRVPWHGGSLVSHDINLISTQRRPHLVALIGPHDAGKTTYLAALHLICCRQRLDPESAFAGSLTLVGWERIVAALKYPNEDNLAPTYPPHTPYSDARQPGMLHYSLRTREKRRELLFTDAPGEWFTTWASNPSDPRSKGAQWTVANADSFLLFIDCGALAGADKGKARTRIESLANRLAEQSHGRRIGVIWAKSDIEIPSAVRASVKETLKIALPESKHFATSVKRTDDKSTEVVEPFIDSFQFITASGTQVIEFSDLLPKSSPDDAFLSYRGAFSV